MPELKPIVIDTQTQPWEARFNEKLGARSIAKTCS